MTATDRPTVRSTDHAPTPDVEATPPGADPPTSRAFRIMSWVVVLFGTAAYVFGVSELVLMWLPDRALAWVLGDGDPHPPELDFRAEFIHIGVTAGALLASLVVQLRNPARRVAPMLLLWLGWIAAVPVMAMCGSLEPMDFIVVATFTMLLVLHPARGEMRRRPALDSWQLGLLCVGVIPWLVRAGTAIGDARDADGLPDVGGSAAHIVASNVPIAIVILLLASLLGATDHPGWRVPAWTAGLGSIVIGVHAFVFDEQSASIARPWALAATFWGATYLVASIARSRRGAARS